MNRARFDLSVGAQLWFEGALWHVRRIDANGVELTNGRSAIRVSVAKLYSNASLVVEPELSDTEDELVAVVLGSITGEQRQALEERAKHIREVIASSSEGSAKTATEAYKKKADELGVSVRTIERWVAGYRDSGLAGLADSRLLRRRKSRIDPRWDAMCERILNELVPSSTPTQNRVIEASPVSCTPRYV